MAAWQRNQGAGTNPRECVLFNKIIIIMKYYNYRVYHYYTQECLKIHHRHSARSASAEMKGFPNPLPGLFECLAATGGVVGSAQRDDVPSDELQR